MFVSCSTIGGIRSGAVPELFLIDQIRTLLRVHDAGYHRVEIIYNNQPQWVGKTIMEALGELSLEPYSIHLPKFIFSYSDDEFTAFTAAAYPFIEKLGIQVAVLHPPDPSQIMNTDWSKRFHTLLELSGKAHCRLTLENMPYLPNVDQFILDHISKNGSTTLGVTIDLEYMRYNGSDIGELIEMFGKRLLNVHFRDGDGNLVDSEGHRRYLLPGSGNIDLLGVIRMLHRSGYSGVLTVEVSHRQRDNIIKAKAFLEDILRSIGIQL